MKFKISKKGEMTTEQIVFLVLLIIGFAIILYFLLGLNLGKQTTEDVCHNSVVLSASAPFEVPIDCSRGYLCITQDGSCEKMTSPIKEKVKTEEEFYGVLADYSANCWWMFGEGKLNYLGKEYKPQLHCSICYQVGFDDSINNIFPTGKFERNNLYKYMINNKMSNEEQTYAEYMFEDFNLEEFIKEGNKEAKTDEIYYIMMGSHSEVSTLGWVVGASIVTVAGVTIGVLTGGTGLAIAWTAVKVGVVAGGAAGYGSSLLIPLIEGKSGNDFLPPFLIEANSDEFKGLDCRDIATKS